MVRYALIRDCVLVAASGNSGDASRAGDVVCFYYSGHGATEPDPQPGLANHWAQCLAMADGNKILDRDLADAVGSVADGLNLTIILDSCHSGGMGEAVGVPETIKGLPLPEGAADAREPEAGAGFTAGEEPPRYRGGAPVQSQAPVQVGFASP